MENPLYQNIKGISNKVNKSLDFVMLESIRIMVTSRYISYNTSTAAAECGGRAVRNH